MKVLKKATLKGKIKQPNFNHNSLSLELPLLIDFIEQLCNFHEF